jgi:hypothetical protein
LKGPQFLKDRGGDKARGGKSGRGSTPAAAAPGMSALWSSLLLLRKLALENP